MADTDLHVEMKNVGAVSRDDIEKDSKSSEDSALLSSSQGGSLPSLDTCEVTPPPGAATFSVKSWFCYVQKRKFLNYDSATFESPYGMHLSFLLFTNAVLAALAIYLALRVVLTRPPVDILGPAADWTVPTIEATVRAYDAECSGNGNYWIDSVTAASACECHQCYLGPNCQHVNVTCDLDVSSGNPLLFEDFWKAQPSRGDVFLPASYRMGYLNRAPNSPWEGPFWQSEMLEAAVRALHTKVGNAVVEGKHLVLGVGSTQLIHAAMYAFSDANSSEPLVITSAPPYYQAYKAAASWAESSLFRWGGSTTDPDVLSASTTLEFVTSPNNPDGAPRSAAFSGPHAHSVYDLAYYWPHFTPIPAPADDDVMLFTLSKLTGHAGTRIGWAVVRDPLVAERMAFAMKTLTLGVPHEPQLRALQLLTSVLSAYDSYDPSPPEPKNGFLDSHHVATQGLLFSFAAALMQDRWQRLQTVFSVSEGEGRSERFSLQLLESAPCTFFKTKREATPAYAWIRCNDAADVDCFLVFRGYGVIGRSGVVYGGGEEYVRFSLLVRQSTFDLLVDRLLNILGGR